MTQALKALSDLTAASNKAKAEQAAKAVPVNQATNPSANAALAVAALAAVAKTVAANQTTPNVEAIADNTAELFDIEDIESMEVIIVINGNEHVVFSI